MRTSVVIIWIALTGNTLWYVSAYGRNVPFWDDNYRVPVLTGARPLTLSWLVKQHDEHRLIVPKLIWYALGPVPWLKCQYLNVLLLSATAFLLMLKSGFKWHDIMYPALLLHLGHYQNLTWGSQILYTLSVFLAVLLLLYENRYVTFGASLLLIGCGANGMMFAPFSIYLLLRKRAWTLGAVLILVVGCYFIGFHRPAQKLPPPRDLMAFLESTQRFLATCWGCQWGWYYECAWLAVDAVYVAALIVQRKRITSVAPSPVIARNLAGRTSSFVWLLMTVALKRSRCETKESTRRKNRMPTTASHPFAFAFWVRGSVDCLRSNSGPISKRIRDPST